MTQNLTGEPSLGLVLSTWFIMYLHGDRPGGLPNDFLSRGSSALLVFDTVFCDEDALDAEEKFAGTWLSSDLFLALKEEGLLTPVPLRTHIQEGFITHLEETGVAAVARDAMGVELASLKTRTGSLARLQLPQLLLWLNHYIFASLDMPRSLLYEWQENHFKVSPPRSLRQRRQILPIVHEDEEVARSIKHRRQLVSAVKALLPEFSLLPPIVPRTEAANALKENITREKIALYRWIYGDPRMPRERYHEIRLGPDFRRLDATIDKSRRAEAWQNFELLMKVRAATKDIRTGMQSIITDVIEERRTVEDVRSELIQHQQEMVSHLTTQHTVRIDVGLAGVGLVVAIAEILGALSGVTPGVTPLSPISLGLAANELWKVRSKHQQYGHLRQQYPLTWLLRDFEHLDNIQQKKLTPRR